ncbi:MAG: hypothetical protein NZ888_02595 [Candidatus Nitrosocaldus sp.]|nr:hypothetical protein [Candidatus Nitrosocaldus sp.]MDW8000022.1 hypothetical protein [Candidatus Nitrosocaldus sp.]
MLGYDRKILLIATIPILTVVIVISIITFLQPTSQRAVATYVPMPDERNGIKIVSQVLSSSTEVDSSTGNIVPVTHRGERVEIRTKLINTSNEDIEVGGSITRTFKVFNGDGVVVFGWRSIGDLAKPLVLRAGEERDVGPHWWAVNVYENNRLVDAPPGKYIIRIEIMEAGVASDSLVIVK